MALLTWSESSSVNVRALDAQHRTLFDLVNQLHEAMMKGQAGSMTGPILQKLLDYTKTHFAAEETLLKNTKFPGLVAHQQKHRALIKQVQDFSARFEKGEITLSLKLLHFLRDWLTDHIQKVDKEYASWLNEHGVK